MSRWAAFYFACAAGLALCCLQPQLSDSPQAYAFFCMVSLYLAFRDSKL